ncbi:MAG: hypothetical protein K2I96_04450 [Lachnospiraceae bacterium]|nr:hypothetical protein [Lachnospiraceae bacterium]
MNGGKRDIDEKSRIFIVTDMYSVINRVWNGGSAEEEMLQPNMEENVVSVNFDDVATQSEPTEQYCNYLTQTTENMFVDEAGIESADAHPQ